MHNEKCVLDIKNEVHSVAMSKNGTLFISKHIIGHVLNAVATSARIHKSSIYPDHKS